MHQPIAPTKIDYLSIRGQIIALGELIGGLLDDEKFDNGENSIFIIIQSTLIDLVKPHIDLRINKKDEFEKLLQWIELYVNEAVGVEIGCIIKWQDNAIEFTQASDEEILARIGYLKQVFTNASMGDLTGREDN